MSEKIKIPCPGFCTGIPNHNGITVDTRSYHKALDAIIDADKLYVYTAGSDDPIGKVYGYERRGQEMSIMVEPIGDQLARHLEAGYVGAYGRMNVNLAGMADATVVEFERYTLTFTEEL